MTLLGTIILGESGHGSDGNEGVLHIPESFTITGASPLDRLILYTGYSSYPSVEMPSVYSIAPFDWAKQIIIRKKHIIYFLWKFTEIIKIIGIELA